MQIEVSPQELFEIVFCLRREAAHLAGSKRNFPLAIAQRLGGELSLDTFRLYRAALTERSRKNGRHTFG